MNKYNRYCDNTQTVKAFKLGAPIEKSMAIKDFDFKNNHYAYLEDNKVDNALIWVLKIPTFEQMLGWLKEKGFGISIMACEDVELDGIYGEDLGRLGSIKESIDVMLEYLEKEK